MLIWTLYILYAFIQAVLTARYVFTDNDRREGAVFMVVVMTILAPITTAGLLIYGFNVGVKWLVTYRSPEKTETK